MSRSGMGRRGAAFADYVMIVAGIALLLAAAIPTLRARSFQTLVDEAAADVETLRAASEQHFASTRAWPAAGDPGAIPAEVANAFIGIGGIVLRSGQDELLAELLARYGAQASFVRDSTWTLIVGVTPGG